MNPDNAPDFLQAGASHVIVTSYVFRDGRINYENLDRLVRRVGRDRLVLDLSCRKRQGRYYIVTDRWQKFTEEEVTLKLLERLSRQCGEFLVHAVDVEGKPPALRRNWYGCWLRWKVFLSPTPEASAASGIWSS